MLFAKQLAITWGDNPGYWTWFRILESKFETVALLLLVCWSQIRGRTNTRFLSPKARYSVYIVFTKTDQGYGFKDVPIKAEVGIVGQEASRRYVCFDKEEDAEENGEEEEERSNLLKPEERDGWMEIELGEFFNEGGLMNSDEIEMSALETRPAK